MARPRILFATQQMPWPKDSGGNIRTYFMLEALAEAFEVVLCTTSDGSTAAREGEIRLGDLCAKVHLVRDDKQHSSLGMALGLGASLLRGLPAVLMHNENRALRAAITSELAGGSIDALHINHLDTALYFDLSKGPPAVIDTHNLLFEYYARRAEVEKGALRRAVCRREARLLTKYEPDVFRQLGRVVVCSEKERQSLLALDSTLPVSVVPNGVDCGEFRPAASEVEPANQDLVFVGDMAYGPNQDAALRFIHEILPQVQVDVPSARFLAVGKNPPAELQALGDTREDVVVTGFVDDVRDWVHSAAVYVVPIRYGSGTRLKVLEAFALGKATVSTRIGAEGIETHEGEDILLRDEVGEMAAAIVELLGDASMRARLARVARANVEANYDWPMLGARLVEIHRGVLGS